MSLNRMLMASAAAVGLLLASQGLARAQATSDSNTQSVDANILTGISITIGPAIPTWSLATSGTSTTSGTFVVKSNLRFGILQNSDVGTKGANANHLYEYNGGYVASGAFIFAPLRIQANGNGLQDVSLNPAGVTLINNQNVTPNAGTTYTVGFSQATDYSDAALAAPASYHIVMTYTASAAAV